MPVRFDVHVPESSPEIVDLCLERWTVDVGDSVEPGTVLCELVPLTQRYLLRRRAERTPFLARFRPKVEQRHISVDHAPTIVVIAAEHGIVGELGVTPPATVLVNDRVARIDIGDESGDGGRFSVLAEIVRADNGAPE
jgi:hypothetical protein